MGAVTSRRAWRVRLGGVAVGLLLLVPAAAGVAVAKAGPRRLKHCWTYMKKIKAGEATGHNFVQLAYEGKDFSFVERFLEERAADKHEGHREAALKGLLFAFPASESARAVREFEVLADRPYFHLEEDEAQNAPITGVTLTPAERVARWRAFVREYPDFPGRDNAGYELARAEEMSGDAVGAFDTLSDALHWGDEDMAPAIASRLANVTDAQLSLEDTVALADRFGDVRFRSLLRYSAAVKMARAWRFREAVARLDSFVAEVEGGASVALLAESSRYFVWRGSDGKPQVRTGAFLADVAEQRALWARLAALESAAESDTHARPHAFRHMGDVVIAEPHTFENLVLHDHIRTDRFGDRPSSHEGRHDEAFEQFSTERNHLAQAAALYETAAREGAPGPERTRALVGVATARVGLLGFWGWQEGHAVPMDREALEDDAARAVALALADGANQGTRPLVEARTCAAWSATVAEVKRSVREGHVAFWHGSEYALARDLRKRAVALWHQPIEKPALALGHKQGG